MKKIFLFLTIATSTIFAQAPANDACGGAINLGTLATANGVCPGSGVINGAATTTVGTSANATTENPYNTVINCEAGTTDMATPAIDVWYRFTSAAGSANALQVAITNFPGVHFAVYEAPAGNCTGLVPRGCSLDGAITIEPIQASTVFYLQVSGNTATLTDPSFNISIQNNFNCNDCFTTGEITATPLPVNGAYNPGQTVNFCFHVDKYTEVSVNWLHGVQLGLGSGWNAASVVASPATSWGGDGTWNYYPGGIVSNNNGAAWPMGWYFNRTAAPIGGTGTAGDTNPGNNYGDEAEGTGTVPAGSWNFCFNVTTAAVCSPGSDLSVTFNTSGDGESGFYGSLACTTDPPLKFLAQGACCPPTMASTSLTCFGDATGSATATPVGAGAPFIYNWSGPAGYTNTSTGAGASVISGLAAGVYTLSTKDVNLCERITTVTVTQPTSVTATPSSTNATCLALGSAAVVAAGGVPGYTYSWLPSGGTGATASGLSAGIYTVTVRDSKLCPRTATVNITSTGTVTSGFTGAGTQCLTGNSFTFGNSGTAAVSYNWSFNPAAGAPAASTATNYGPVAFTAAGTYTVSHTVTNGVCVNTTTQVVTINPNPAFTIVPTNPVCTLPNGQIVINNTSSGGQTVNFTSSLGTVTGQTVTGLSGGTTPVITASNTTGCTFTLSQAMVNQPGPTNFALTSTITGCAAPTGAIAFNTPVGGTGGFTYSHNSGAFTATSPITALAAGIQTVTVRDNNGCTFTKTITVGTAVGPTAITGNTTAAACGATNGSYTLTGITGGTPTYSYNLNGGALTTASVVSSLAAGLHPVSVTDANGCTFATTFNIPSLSGPTAITVTAVQPSCGLNNGTATITAVTGGVPTFSYSFDGGGFTTTNSIAGLAAGNHTATVRDGNGCPLPVTFSLTNPGTPTANIVNTTSVACNAGATGAFTVSATGGTTGYTYSITPTGAANGTGLFSGLTAQTYTVKVFDGAGCTYSLTNTISQPTAVSLTLTPLAVSCNGGSNGTITATGGGGTPTYNFAIDGGAAQASGVFTGLTAGVHSVIVRDLNNCPLTRTVNVTQPTALALGYTVTPTACVGATGTATIGVTGGTPVYNYSVDAVATSSLPSSLAFGSHTISVTDNNGCPISTTFNTPMVSGPTSASIVASNATCGSENATATVVSVTGGGGTNTFNFDNAGFTVSNTVGSLAAGSHTVVIKDVNQCTLTANYNVNNTGSPTSNVIATNSVTCFGGNNGGFSVNTTGGSPGYSYTLTPGGIVNTTGVFSGLTAQNYNVTVKDGVGCATSVTNTIIEPTALTLSLTPTHLLCNGISSGSIAASGAGGTGTLNYSINNGVFGGSSNFTSLPAATHTIVVRDVNTCTLSAQVILTQPTALTLTTTTTPNSCNGTVGSATFAVNGGVTAYSYSVDAVAVGNNTPSGLTSATHSVTVKDNNGCLIGASFTVGTVTGPSAMTFTTTNSTCGNTNGTATVTSVTGGLSAYQYSYDGGAFTTNNFVSSLGAGTHTVTVLDANSCTLTATYNVLNTGSPAVNIVGATPALCFGGATGSFTASASGGSGTPYTYSITSAAGSNTTGVFGGLLMNVYTVVAKDAVGCAVQTTVQITEPTPVTVTVSSLPAKCNGAANGTITITGMGGVGSYSTSLNGAAYLPTNTYSTVGMGFYNVNILDGNNCPAATTVQVTQPAALNISISTQNANCSAPNGLASATVTGGSGGYSYAWSGGAGSSSTTNPVVSGNYTLNVTDVNSCTATAVANIGLTPGGVAVISNTTAIGCFGGNDGTITADMPGGANPITYAWSPGSQTGPTATGLSAGSYTCNVTDFYGCKATVVGTLVNPPVLNATVSAIPVKCFSEATGTVSSGATGGTGAYTFLWTSNGGTTAIVPNVFAGTHTVIVTDAKNCSTTQTVLVTQPTAIALTATATTANCNQADGSATVTANGGAGGYTYTWPSPIPSGPSISGQLAGTYTVNVSDANGCIETLAATIPNSAGPSVSISTKTDVACFNGNTAAATAAVTGGSGNFTYLWSPSNATGATAANLFMGVHTVTITDNVSGCRATTSVTITEPPVLTASTVPTHPKCTGNLDGFGFVVATGGTSPYTYTWTAGGGNNATSNNYGAGNYAVTVKDNNGCLVITPLTLIDPALMLASTIHTNVSCFGTCNGVAIASTTNAIAPVNYSWVGGSSPVPSQTLTGACATNYTLTATDFNGCVAKSIVNITQPPLLTANIASSGSVTCRDGNDGFATVSPGGGTVGYTFSWSNISATGTTASSLTAGVYTVTVTDALNCRASDVVTINEPAPLAYTLGVNDPKCFGDCSGTGTVTTSGGAGAVSLLWRPNLTAGNFANNLCVGAQTLEMTYNGTCKTIETFTLSEPNQIQIVMTQTNSTCGFANGDAHAAVTGGVFPYTFDWSNGIQAPDNYSVTAGPYTFTVTDFNGCKEEASALINDITGPVVAVTQQTNVSCYGGNNGSAFATINGGTPSYTINWSGSGTPSSSSTQTFVGISAGLCNITVRDALGCVGSASVQITQPPILNTAITQYSNVSCFNLTDGSATISHNGGFPNYSYLWLPAVANNSVAAVTGLGAGTYTAIVTDQNGCKSSKEIIITQPAELKIVNVTTNSITCNGSGNGSIDVDATGGTAPYNYTWTPTNTNSDFIFNLAQGGYSVYIADTRGCNTQTIVSIQEPPLLTASISSSLSTCGLANGSATITTNGGTIISPSAPYTYNWSTPTAATTSVVTGLASGIVFNCITTDKNGCNLTQTVMITAAPQPTITSITSTMPKCFGGSDGTITMNYAGGAPNYVVNWQNPIVNPLPFGTTALTQSVSGVTTGVWTATLTDTYGCKTNSVVIVNQPQLLTVDPSTTYSICYGQQTQISATAGGGTFPYTYTWTSTIGTPLPNTPGPHLINTLTNATFSVTIDDANGCGFKTKVISINVGPPIIATPHASTVCHNDAATLIPTITSPGNGSPYSYTWTPAASGSTNVVIGNYPLSPQYYTLSIGDGCSLPSAPIVFTVNVNPLPTGSISVNSFTACSPANGIVFTAVSNNPTSDTYNWDINKAFAGTGVQINPQLSNAGTYTVDLSITNSFGCSSPANAPATVTVFPAPTASFVPNPRTVSIIDPTIEFTNVSQGATDYLWEFGDPSTAGQAINTPNANSTNNTVNPIHTFNFVGTYNVYLQAISSMGCTDIIMIPIEVTPDFSVFIPNAFTPCTADGACNGINDVFYPKGVGINEDNYRLDIFDRWGENIFTSTSFRKGWDGSVKGSSKIAQQGVYIYKLLVYDLQGNKHPFVGHVTLIKGE